MKRIIFSFTLLFTVVIISCSTLNVQPYDIKKSNQRILKEYQKSKVKLNIFTFSKNPEIQSRKHCRMNWEVGVDDGFETYIQTALTSELEQANLAAGDSTLIFSGHLEELDLDIGIVESTWSMKVIYKLKNKEYFTINCSYTFESTFDVEAVCNQAKNNYVVVVQKLIKKTILHPKFKALFE